MGPFKAGELDFKSSPAYYFGEIPVGPFRKPTWCQSAWHEPHASQSRLLNRANTVCCSDEKRGSRGALIVAITPPGLWLIPLRKPHVGGLTLRTHVGSKKNEDRDDSNPKSATSLKIQRIVLRYWKSIFTLFQLEKFFYLMAAVGMEWTCDVRYIM